MEEGGKIHGPEYVLHLFARFSSVTVWKASWKGWVLWWDLVWKQERRCSFFQSNSLLRKQRFKPCCYVYILAHIIPIAGMLIIHMYGQDHDISVYMRQRLHVMPLLHLAKMLGWEGLYERLQNGEVELRWLASPGLLQAVPLGGS